MVASEIEIPKQMSVQERIRLLQARTESASTNQPRRPPPVRARRVSANGDGNPVSREGTGRSNQQSPELKNVDNLVSVKKSDAPRLMSGPLGSSKLVSGPLGGKGTLNLSKDSTHEESLVSSRTSRRGEPEQEIAPARERADFVSESTRKYGKERNSVRELREMRELQRLQERAMPKSIARSFEKTDYEKSTLQKKPSDGAPPLRLPTRGGPPSREPVSSRELLSHRSNPISVRESRELTSHRSNPPNREPLSSRGGHSTRELVSHRTAPPTREHLLRSGPLGRMEREREFSRERDLPRNLPPAALSSGRKAFAPRGPSERRFDPSERRGVKRTAFDLDLENELKKPLSAGPETLLYVFNLH